MTTALMIAALSQGVTLSLPAMPLERAVNELESALERPLKLEAGLDRNTLLIEVRDMDEQRLLDAVAEAVHAKWVEERDGSLRLTRSRETRRQLEAEQLAFRTRNIEEALQEFQEEAAKIDEQSVIDTAQNAVALFERLISGQPDQLDLAQTLGMRTGGPGKKLLAGLLESISAVELAKLRPGERVVYCNRPTNLQHRLPAVSDKHLTEFRRLQSLYREEVRASLVTHPYGEQLQTRDPRTLGAFDAAEAHYVMVFVTTSEAGTHLFASGQLHAADGSQLIDAPIGRFLSPIVQTVSPVEAETVRVAFTPEPKSAVPYILAYAPRTVSAIGLDESFIEECRNRLDDPLVHEPLDEYFGAMLRPAALATDLDVVACIPDRAAFGQWGVQQPGVLLGVNSKMLSALLNEVEQQWQCEWSMEDGLLSIVPREPTLDESIYLDRAAFARLLDSRRENRKVSLESAARYAVEQISPLAMSGFDSLHLQALSVARGNVADRNVIDRLSLPVWRFIGLAAGTDGFRNGARIRYSQMSPQAREQLVKTCGQARYFIRQLGAAEYRFLEPTLFLAQGIDPGTTLTIDLETEPVATTLNRAEGTPPFTWTLDNTPNPSDSNYLWQADSTRRMTVRMPLNPSVEVQSYFIEPVAPRENAWVEFSSLPVALRDAIRSGG